ncbi:MAG TPA: DUF3016 domain-containing protein [Pseudoxanthomonas sp.]
MRISALLVGLALACLLAGSAAARTRNVTDADAPRSLPAEGPVGVSWSDPAQFTEIRYSHNRWESQRGNWVAKLAEHLRKSTEKALPAGQRVEFNITDIKLAGDYEPWRSPNAHDVRIVRDIYPPRMTFIFTRYGADGQVIGQGERKLVDMGFLASGSRLDSDPLRYEKRMVDDWVRRELKPDRGLSAR